MLAHPINLRFVLINRRQSVIVAVFADELVLVRMRSEDRVTVARMALFVRTSFTTFFPDGGNIGIRAAIVILGLPVDTFASVFILGSTAPTCVTNTVDERAVIIVFAVIAGVDMIFLLAVTVFTSDRIHTDLRFPHGGAFAIFVRDGPDRSIIKTAELVEIKITSPNAILETKGSDLGGGRGDNDRLHHDVGEVRRERNAEDVRRSSK